MFDALLPPGLQWYWKADFVNELSDEAIAAHVEARREVPTMLSTMHLYPIDGAATASASDETAWSYRDAKWAQVIVGIDPDPANKRRIIDWAQDTGTRSTRTRRGRRLRELHDGRGRGRASRRPTATNYARLATIKASVRPVEPVPREPEHQAVGDGRLAALRAAPVRDIIAARCCPSLHSSAI